MKASRPEPFLLLLRQGPPDQLRLRETGPHRGRNLRRQGPVSLVL